MNGTLSWLHLSDFHTGSDDHGQRQLFIELLEHIKEHVNNNGLPDLIIVSGDLANRGQAREYSKLADEFFLPLVEITGSKVRYYTVPGNHDVDRTQARIIQFNGIIKQCPSMFDPTVEGLSDRRTVLPRFENFIRGDLFNLGISHWLASEAGTFVDRFAIGDHEVSIIGLNTAWLSNGDSDRHHLTPGKAALESALRLAKGSQLKLVVGHHPADWFADDQVEPIGALISREGAVYLHGHLHRTRAKLDSSGYTSFLALQAGAAFQARDSDQWINRIVWARTDLERREISVEPYQWSSRHQEFTVDSAAFNSKLRRAGTDHWVLPIPDGSAPQPKKLSLSGSVPSPASFSWPGWLRVDRHMVEKGPDAAADRSRIIAYFDGRSPSWMEALDSAVPRRAVVRDLIEAIRAAAAQSAPSTHLLLGAGGEGKSTAIRQVAGEIAIASEAWEVIWHEEPDTPLKPDFIRALRNRNGKPVLIASDDAELIASDVFNAVKLLHEQGRRHVHFLLSARDTDWLSVEADQLAWRLYTAFTLTRLRGLSAADAHAIVEAWSRFGQEGLGRLAGLSIEEAASRLVEESLLEKHAGEGAFLGAMLRTRVGEELKAHVASLLNRLRQRSCPCGTLADAFAYIAALHAENVLVLNKDVLTVALGCKSATELKRHVLGPMGEEAAVGSTGGTCILTRHRAIAETAVQLLGPKIDFDEVFVDLVLAAVQVKSDGFVVPSLEQYEYLSKHFHKKGNVERAVRIAHALVKRYPSNYLYVSKLANLYRAAGQPESAVNLFRRTPASCQKDRIFLQEWAASEAEVGCAATASYLYWLSLSDNVEFRQVTNDKARTALVGMAQTLIQLGDQLNDPRANVGGQCAAYLCRRLKLDSTTKNKLAELHLTVPAGEAATEFGPSNGLTTLTQAAMAAWQNKEHPASESLPAPAQTSTTGLATLLGFARHANSLELKVHTK